MADNQRGNPPDTPTAAGGPGEPTATATGPDGESPGPAVPDVAPPASDGEPPASDGGPAAPDGGPVALTPPGGRAPGDGPVPPGTPWPGYPPIARRNPPIGNLWPEPADSRALTGLAAAAIGGAGAAVFLPIGPAGIGWPLLGIVMLGAMLLVNGRRRVTPAQIGWGVTAMALLSVVAIRAAGWLAALCVLTAAVALVLAAGHARTVRDHALAAITIPVGAFRGLPWVVRGVRTMRGRAGGARLVISSAVGVVLLLIFGGLLSAADDRFARVLSSILPELDQETFVRWTFVFGFFAFATLGAAFTVASPPRPGNSAKAPVRPLRRLEWAIPIGMLVALFALFVAVQTTPMFGAVDPQVRNEGPLTYAGHARSGFWQLSLVSVLTLPVIGAAARWAPKEGGGDRRLLRILAGSLAVLTLLIVFSALYRMWAYQNAYGFTVPRLLVMSCEVWIGLVYVLVIAAGVRLRAGWLPTAVIGTAMAALLTLAAVNPEALVAERNIARFHTTGRLDTVYLGTLSTDILPELPGLPADRRSDIEERIRPGGTGDWRSWNLSRDR